MILPDLRPWASTRSVWRKHPGYALAWGLNVAGAGYFGATAIGCDPSRFESPTWDGLRDSLGVPGFGWLLITCCVLLVAGAWLPARAMMTTFWVLSAVYLTVGYYFAAGVDDLHAAPWGPGFGVILGLWQVTQAEAYRRSLRGRS